MASKDSDNPWKDVIQALFEPFMLFVSPEAHSEIDWSKKPKFLDKELRQVAPEFLIKRRIADILASVTLKDKTESWIAIHVEIQSHKDINFAERMYIYNHRIWERFKKEVFSIAVLADRSTHWRPQTFSRGKWGLSVEMHFPILKLRDYEDRKEELASSSNPFALIVLIYLEAQKNAGDPASNYQLSRNLIKGFFRRGYSTERSFAILRFIGAVLRMPEALVNQFLMDVEKERGDEAMPYMFPFEREAMKRGELIGEERGEQRGEQRGRQGAYIKAMKTFLSTRFGPTKAARAIERLYGIKDSNALESLLEITCKAKTLDEVLANYPKAKASPKKISKTKVQKSKTGAKRSVKAKKPSTRKG